MFVDVADSTSESLANHAMPCRAIGPIHVCFDF